MSSDARCASPSVRKSYIVNEPRNDTTSVCTPSRCVLGRHPAPHLFAVVGDDNKLGQVDHVAVVGKKQLGLPAKLGLQAPGISMTMMTCTALRTRWAKAEVEQPQQSSATTCSGRRKQCVPHSPGTR